MDAKWLWIENNREWTVWKKYTDINWSCRKNKLEVAKQIYEGKANELKRKERLRNNGWVEIIYTRYKCTHRNYQEPLIQNIFSQWLYINCGGKLHKPSKRCGYLNMFPTVTLWTWISGQLSSRYQSCAKHLKEWSTISISTYKKHLFLHC